MNFDIGSRRQKTLSKNEELYDDRYCDIHNLLKGLNEFVPYFPDFLTDFD